MPDAFAWQKVYIDEHDNVIAPPGDEEEEGAPATLCVAEQLKSLRRFSGAIAHALAQHFQARFQPARCPDAPACTVCSSFDSTWHCRGPLG